MDTVRFALRTMLKTPLTTGVAVVSLALGIGANTAIFSLFHQMLLQSLPVSAPEELVNLSAPGPKPGSQSCGQAGPCDDVFSYPMFRDLQRVQTGFTGIAAHIPFSANLAYAAQTINAQALLISGSYFPVLGLQPALGRLLSPADDELIGQHFVTVLAYRYWQDRLGGDPSVLNQVITVNGQPLTIVGVAPRGFDGTTLGARPSLYVPLTMRGLMSRGTEAAFENRRSYWAYLFARVRPDVSLDVARAQLSTAYQAIVNDVEAPLQRGMSDQTLARFRTKDLGVVSGPRGQSSLHNEARTPLILLLATTAVVLLIACANIANLLLAKGAQRSQEMAIRGSLGASRTHLVGQLLTESCLLALLGGVASLFVARWTLAGIGAFLPAEAGDTLTLTLRPTVLLFAGGVSLGTGFLFGMYPALHSTRPDLVTALREGSGQPAGARAAARFRTVLVTAQIALSMALLFAAGLFIKSLVNVSRVDLGLSTQNVVTFAISPELNAYEAERSRALFQRVEEHVAALPGVTGVAAARVPLLAGNNWGNDVSVEGFEFTPDVDANARFNLVGPGYFSTLGIPLLSGREFTAADVVGTPRVAVVNETFTRKFGLPGREAVGKLMARGSGRSDLDIQIVGVIGDAKYSEVKQVTPPLYFTPYRQDTAVGNLTFYVRTAVDPASVLRSVPDVIRRLDPNLPVEELKLLETQVKENVILDRLIGTLSSAFAGLATLLAAVGLYGVLAYTVAQRTREFGLRMALGADGSRVRGMVLGHVGRMTVVGAIIGLAGAIGLGRAARSLLFELSGYDPMVIGLVGLLLAAVALGAGYVPALRASRVDPMRALRYE
ncbi:MAG TPA: ABC transporter permease [Gemmatimonadales bacterium]|nr:ABC transporter permease [Gemmatimonadales bacterium]